jgi:type I restriction enzyme, S subunit
MSFPRYPAYKPSGVEWLGEVPEHWDEKPLKTVASLNDEVLTESISPDYELEYVDIGSVSLTKGIESTETIAFGDAPSRARRVPRDGDVLVSTVRTYLKAIAPVISPPSNLVASTGFAVVRPKSGFQPGFLKYALQEEHFIQQVISQSTGISYPAINASDIARISVCMPDSSEQQAISTFLDRETAKIDALIAEQQRLIELLQEKRQAVISHAVTKGLNPNAPMKDSGVEWLGEVPEHWAITRLDRVGDFEAGKAHEPFVSEGGIYALANARFVSTNGKAAKRSDVQLTPALEGDILMVMSDLPNGRALARAYHVGHNEKIAVNQRVCRIRITRGTSRFYYYFLNRNPGLLWFNDGANQTHIPNSGFTKLVAIEPPLNEQHAIAGMLDCLNAETDRLMESAEDMSKLLVERRSALISAAVTGQIDVRGLVEAEGSEQ